ncbi:recombinase family protein [Falsiroseomonas sp. HC035]|uniref:recombinase family protein n=1 Tax=Falsiroseomonas sp. HC035 TaxID=3390999 RepID=UPI003D31E23D
MKHCCGYIRVSTADQAREGVSLDSQRERLTAYCAMRGLDLVDIIADEGISGTIPLADRTGGAKLLEMAKRRTVTEVVALKLDRLFRNAHDALGRMAHWDKASVGLHLIDMGGAAVDTRSAMGRMMLTMMAGFAQFERDLISERTAASLQFKKRQRAVYGPIPLGFAREGDNLVRDEREALLVARIRLLRDQGVPLRKIANALNADGITGKAGGRFYASTVQAILGNTIHA